MKYKCLIFGSIAVVAIVGAYLLGSKKEHDKAAKVIDPIMKKIFDLDNQLNLAVENGWTARQFQDSLLNPNALPETAEKPEVPDELTV